MLKHLRRVLAMAAATAAMTAAAAAGPEVVAGPGFNPECFAPFNADTKYLKFPKKEGPYRIALANGFVGNTWRIQMIKTAKAFSEQPEIAKHIKELKVVSTGTDVAAQIAAIDKARPEVIIDVELLEVDRTRLQEYGLQLASANASKYQTR